MTDQLARTIQRARLKRGWRQLDLATAAGVGRSWLGALETGGIKGTTGGAPEKLLRVAEALDLDGAALLAMVGRAAPAGPPPWDELLEEMRLTRVAVTDNRDLLHQLAGASDREVAALADRLSERVGEAIALALPEELLVQLRDALVRAAQGSEESETE